MMLAGRSVDCTEAERLGLVLDVVPDEQVLERSLTIARAIAADTVSPAGK